MGDVYTHRRRAFGTSLFIVNLCGHVLTLSFILSKHRRSSLRDVVPKISAAPRRRGKFYERCAISVAPVVSTQFVAVYKVAEWPTRCQQYGVTWSLYGLVHRVSLRRLGTDSS